MIDPVAVSFTIPLIDIPVAIHWYGMMYVAAFFSAWYLVRQQLQEAGVWQKSIDPEAYEGLFTAMILGVIVGGRLGYVLFYNAGYYSSHPIEVLYVWQGGMSFHGGLMGPLLAGWWYCKKYGLPFLLMADKVAVVAPLGLAFGRMGNFINGELWGRVVVNPADVPWAMVFPGAGPWARHPSQLYEMMLEGIVLFLILWFTRKKIWPQGQRVAMFMTGYAIARIFCEHYREPDAHIGFLFSFVTEGMLLSLPMLIGGVSWVIYLRSRSEKVNKTS